MRKNNDEIRVTKEISGNLDNYEFYNDKEVAELIVAVKATNVTIHIADCPKLTSLVIPSAQKLTGLVIRNCVNLRHLKGGDWGADLLKIINCPNLEDLGGLIAINSTLAVEGCPKLNFLKKIIFAHDCSVEAHGPMDFTSLVEGPPYYLNNGRIFRYIRVVSYFSKRASTREQMDLGEAIFKAEVVRDTPLTQLAISDLSDSLMADLVDRRLKGLS